MSFILPRLIAFLSLLILFLLFSVSSQPVRADIASHIVISEVQIARTGASTDEFVELYNPTDADVNLSTWKLTRKTSTGTESVLVSTLSGTIKAKGYYLLTPQTGYTGSASADQAYSELNSISANNTVLLYGAGGILLVDKVGFGTALDREETSETSPADDTSRERIANAASTITSMAIGGIDEFTGNGEDTDNNAADFVLRSTPQPQNSSSFEPFPTASPTEIPTEIPTNTPTITPTPTASQIPSPTPTQTLTPSPTVQVSITPTVSPTSTPSPTLTITPTPTFPAIPRFQLACTTKILTFNIMNLKINVPLITCALTRL